MKAFFAWLGLVLLLTACVDPDFRRECQTNSDCSQGQECSQYEFCEFIEACPESTQTLCGDDCVTITSDINHCGSCQPCPDVANATTTACIQGQCQVECLPGYQDMDQDLDAGDQGNGCECGPEDDCGQITCPQGCGELEVCQQGQCVQVECVDDTPCALPTPVCEDNAILTWSGTGTCIDNACDRQPALMACTDTQLCQNATCVDVACTQDAQCPAPESVCEGDIAISYTAPRGTCLPDNVCDYTNITERTDCFPTQRKCQRGLCRDLCADVTCDALPQPYCEENTLVTPLRAACNWRTGQCDVEADRADCGNAFTCQRGFCAPRRTAVIPAGDTTLQNGTVNTITRPFLMQTTEVDRRAYVDRINDDPSTYDSLDETLPVNMVTWREAAIYARELSLDNDLDACYNSDGRPIYNTIANCTGWRLPTWSEWIHAYRAGTDTPWYCGEDASCLETTAHCNASGDVASVGSLAPNPWGLYDMAGNLEEWVHDKNAERGLPSLPTVDWNGPEEGVLQILAGGSASNGAPQCRDISYRTYSTQTFPAPTMGFRLVRTLP